MQKIVDVIFRAFENYQTLVWYIWEIEVEGGEPEYKAVLQEILK